MTKEGETTSLWDDISELGFQIGDMNGEWEKPLKPIEKPKSPTPTKPIVREPKPEPQKKHIKKDGKR